MKPEYQRNEMPPSVDQWLKEAKSDPAAAKVGMFLIHNGTVRQTPKAQVRQGLDDGTEVRAMEFSYDADMVDQAIAETYKLEGIYYIRAWLNRGHLKVGDDIMYLLVGGDIRPNVIKALQFLVEKIKTECVTEVEQKG
jgi:molybdopterin synthase catalytic subunit